MNHKQNASKIKQLKICCTEEWYNRATKVYDKYAKNYRKRLGAVNQNEGYETKKLTVISNTIAWVNLIVCLKKLYMTYFFQL